MKKDVLKVLFLGGLGLFVSIFGYPFLHELGHVVASVLTGADILEMNIFPISNVLCDVSNVGDNGCVIIGFGGLVFPALCSLFIPQKWFVCWYTRALLQGMCALATTISIVSLIFEINHQDDMIQVLRFWEYGKGLLLFVLFCYLFGLILIIAMDGPHKRIYKYFEI